MLIQNIERLSWVDLRTILESSCLPASEKQFLSRDEKFDRIDGVHERTDDLDDELTFFCLLCSFKSDDAYFSFAFNSRFLSSIWLPRLIPI
jgi:hypothetical protein